MQDMKPGRYANCVHIPRVKFVNEADEDMVKSLGDNYDIPPLFESGMFERAFIKHYSLARNERMRCRWREYVQTVETRQFSPFQLPEVRELHFYNSAIRFLPNESIHHQDHRRTLKPGPGVDNVGQMPIPQEALMKRGIADKTSEKTNRGIKSK